MTEEQSFKLAFCWYEPDEWLKIKTTATDADKQDDSYEEWKANAHKAIKEIRANGENVVKIAMKAEEFFGWCEKNGIENNGDSRSKFAVEKLRARSHET